MISKHLVKYILIAAIRDKLMMTLMLMIALGTSMAIFMGSAAITEGESFSVVFGAGGLRFVGVLGLVLFCCFYIRRSFDNKEVEFLLSRPISRFSFLLSHAVSFSILSLFVASVITAVMYFIGVPSPSGLMFWGMSVVSEYIIITVVALFFSMVLSSAAGSALATLGFYSLCRMMGTVLGIVEVSVDMKTAVMGSIMKVVSIIIPRLDLMGQTSWLVYGSKGAAGMQFLSKTSDIVVNFVQQIGLSGFIIIQTILFVSLLLAATAYDFYKREF